MKVVGFKDDWLKRTFICNEEADISIDCNEIISAFKEHNIKRRYETLHASINGNIDVNDTAQLAVSVCRLNMELVSM
jgi:hypothetical protein